jgi:hypothetical protein
VAFVATRPPTLIDAEIAPNAPIIAISTTTAGPPSGA